MLNKLSIIAIEQPIQTPLLKRLLIGSNRYHSFTALKNESSHRIIAEIHFTPLNVEGEHKTGFFANIFNTLNYISCRYNLQPAFIKTAKSVGLKGNISYLTADIKNTDRSIPKHYHTQTLLTGQDNEILKIWDNAVTNAKTLSKEQMAFSSIGTPSSPTVNCRSGTKFIATTLGQTLTPPKSIKRYPHTQVGLRGNLYESLKLSVVN